MQRANGRQRQNNYRFRPRVRDEGKREEGAAAVEQPRPPCQQQQGQGRQFPERERNKEEGGGQRQVFVGEDRRVQPSSSSKTAGAGHNGSENHRQTFSDRGPVPGPSGSVVGVGQREGSRQTEGTDQGGWQVQGRGRWMGSGKAAEERSANPCSERTEKKTNDTTTSDSTDIKKKKKKPSVPKEERLRRREEAALKELYKPKDTKITTIDPAVFLKIKGETVKGGNVPIGAFLFVPESSSAEVPSQASVTDFPTLNFAANRKNVAFKSFASALSATAPSVTPGTSSVVGQRPIPENHSPTTAPLITSDPEEAGGTHASSLITVKRPKLSKRPITVNIGDLLTPSKPKSIIARKLITRSKRDDRANLIRKNPKLTLGNLLDASGPATIHRGKIKQKKKKPSVLKKAVLKSRSLRKEGIGDNDFIETVRNVTDTKVELDRLSDSVDNLNLCDRGDSIPNPVQVTPISEDYSNAKVASCTIEPPEPGETSSVGNEFTKILEEAEQSARKPAPIPDSVISLVRLEMHSRKFRDYCDMFVSKELHGLVIGMMSELHRLQDRIYKADPIKLQTKRRYVNGIKEVLLALKFKKVQLVILAPDIEPNNVQGGLDDKVSEILLLARDTGVPYIFSGNRFILGRCIKQTKSPVSVISVLDKQSVEAQFNDVLHLADTLRQQYQEEFQKRIVKAMSVVA